MSDRDVLERARGDRAADGAEVPLLTRLNERGFRLVQAADAAMLAVILVGTMLVRHGTAWPTYPVPLYLLSFAVVGSVFLASFYFGGLYEREPRLGSPAVVPRAMRQTLAAGGLVALLNLAVTGVFRTVGDLGPNARALPMPITNLVVLIVLGAVGVAANRRLAALVRTRNQGPPRVLLVGDDGEIATARTHLDLDRGRAVVAAEATTTEGLLGAVAAHAVTDVVLLSGRWLDTLYPDALVELERRQVNVLQRVTAQETLFGLERVRQIGGMPFVLLRGHTLATSRARFKRMTDLLFLAAATPVLLPVLAFVTLYQLVAVGPPLLFWQERVGVGGRPFRMVKFRTMVVRAEEDGAPRLATHDDPRIVPACRWLRATRLDELPQVWNILRGEMSLVGPRPERPELTAEFERQIPGYSRRHEVAPGLTGLAQIHGHYHTDPEYKLGYDLQYLVNWSPVLDLEILLRTVWVVITRRI